MGAALSEKLQESISRAGAVAVARRNMVHKRSAWTSVSNHLRANFRRRNCPRASGSSTSHPPIWEWIFVPAGTRSAHPLCFNGFVRNNLSSHSTGIYTRAPRCRGGNGSISVETQSLCNPARWLKGCITSRRKLANNEISATFVTAFSGRRQLSSRDSPAPPHD